MTEQYMHPNLPRTPKFIELSAQLDQARATRDNTPDLIGKFEARKLVGQLSSDLLKALRDHASTSNV